MLRDIDLKLLCVPGGDRVRLASEAQQIQVAGEVVVAALRVVAAAYRICQIERQLPARKVELKLRCHYIYCNWSGKVSRLVKRAVGTQPETHSPVGSIRY